MWVITDGGFSTVQCWSLGVQKRPKNGQLNIFAEFSCFFVFSCFPYLVITFVPFFLFLCLICPTPLAVIFWDFFFIYVSKYHFIAIIITIAIIVSSWRTLSIIWLYLSLCYYHFHHYYHHHHHHRHKHYHYYLCVVIIFNTIPFRHDIIVMVDWA